MSGKNDRRRAILVSASARALAAALAILAAPVAVYAQAASFNFNIPAQDLAPALRAFGRAAGQQLTFDGATVQGKHSQALSGRFTVEEGLSHLLAGTGLKAQFRASGVAIIQAESETSRAAPIAAEAAQDAAQEGGTALEEVVVTATGTNISGVKPVGSEAVTLNRQQIVATGLTTAADVVRTLPQIQSMGFDEAPKAGAGGNTTRGSSVNLRGLGSNATLVLVDGHRLAASGTAQSYTDANQVPLAALERVEVIADGASAIYGSDAVSGVVNYVLRKDYDGAEMSVRGTKTSGYGEWGASFVGGKTWDHVGALGRGNVILALDHSDRSAMLNSESPYLMQNLTAFGGLDNRLSGGTATPGTAGNIVVYTGGTNATLPSAGAYTYYGLPTGNGVGLTASQLKLNQPNLDDTGNYADYLPHTRRDQASIFLNQELNSWLSAYAEAFYTKRRSVSRSLVTSSVTLPTTSPYYVSGITSGDETVQYSFLKDFGVRRTLNNQSSSSVTVGLKASLPNEWKGEFYATHGLDHACGVCYYGTSVNANVLQAEINAGRFNPLSSLAADKAELAKFTGDNIQTSGVMMADAVLKFDGPLFALPGGKVRTAFGFEANYNNNKLSNSTNAEGSSNNFVLTNTTRIDRRVRAAFVELYVPIIGDDNQLPLVRELIVDGAVRTEKYSDFGGTTNPKIGVTWRLNDDLSLRGSWGKSFRAPTLPEMNPYVFSYSYSGAYFYNASGTTNVAPAGLFNGMVIGGSNPNLKPETAKTWSSGFDYTPSQVRGLKISGSYYNIHYNNQIYTNLNPSSYFSSPANAALYSRYATAINNPSTCVNGNTSTYDPKLLPFISGGTLYGGVYNFCGIQVVLDGRYINASSVFQDGLDVQANYSFSPQGLGFWTVGGGLSRILHQKQALVAGDDETSTLGRINYPNKLRGRGTVNWVKGPVSLNLFVNYTGSYLNDIPVTINNVVQPQKKIPAWVTADIGVTYQFPDTVAWAGARGLRLALNIQNVTDRDPPTVISTNGNAFDNQNANPFGRIWTAQITKRF